MGNWIFTQASDANSQTKNEILDIPDFELYTENKNWPWHESPIADKLSSNKNLTYEYHPTIRPIKKDWPWEDSPAFYVVL